VCYIRAHNEHPWNTLADFIARNVMQGNINRVTVLPPRLVRTTLFVHALEWSWLDFARAEDRAAYPVRFTADAEDLLPHGPQDFKVRHQIMGVPIPDSEPRIDEIIKVKASFAFSVIQYNVKTISVEKK
ncbi:unnamed protein product, partial [Prorocentrum cordatum]